MIIKRVNCATSRTFATRCKAIRTLSRYITDAEPWLGDLKQDRSLKNYEFGIDYGWQSHPASRVGLVGTRNLVSQSFASQQLEMIAACYASPKVQQPLLHLVMSWPEAEKPTSDEIHRAVDILLEQTALQDARVIYASHSDTENCHVHMCILRIHASTGLAVGSDWLIKDLHRAIALIEHEQGWARERNARYAVRDREVVEIEALLPEPLVRARAHVLAAANEEKSWSEFAARLSEIGVRYERCGRGARIVHGSAKAKASTVAVSLALPKLEQKFGKLRDQPRSRSEAFERYRIAAREQIERLRVQRDDFIALINATFSRVLARLPVDQGGTNYSAWQKAKESAATAFGSLIDSLSSACFVDASSWKSAGSPGMPAEASISVLSAGSDVQTDRALASLVAEKSCSSHAQFPFYDAQIALLVVDGSQAASVEHAYKVARARWGNPIARGPQEFLQICQATEHEFDKATGDTRDNNRHGIPTASTKSGQTAKSHKHLEALRRRSLCRRLFHADEWDPREWHQLAVTNAERRLTSVVEDESLTNLQFALKGMKHGRE